MNKSAVFATLFVIGYSLAGHGDRVSDDLKNDWEALQYSPHYVLGITQFNDDNEAEKQAALKACKKHDIDLNQWKQIHPKLTTPRSISFFWGLEAFTQDELCIIQKLKITDAGENTVLMGAVFNEDEKLVTRLLAAEGADIEAKDRNGRTVKDYIAGKVGVEPKETLARLLVAC